MSKPKLTCSQTHGTAKSEEKWIYVYQTEVHKGKGVPTLKVGECTVKTGGDVHSTIEKRVGGQTITSGTEAEIVWHGRARYSDGPGYFSDRHVHEKLVKELLVEQDSSGGATEVFKTDLSTVLEAFKAVQEKRPAVIDRTRKADFKPRREQEEAVLKTAQYFQKAAPTLSKPAQFLWNAKMRFGKTFTTYQLAKEMGWKKIAVITFIPSVQDSWKTDLLTHTDFDGWHFVENRAEFEAENTGDDKPVVWFTSFQAMRPDESGAIPTRFYELENSEWDCVVLDEYHFGAHNDNSKFVLSNIRHKHQLLLSGTPFKALDSGEFSEDQIFTWSYVDEQKAKQAWDATKPDLPNPYAALPDLKILTYEVPASIQTEIAYSGANGFSLKEFFAVAQDAETGEESFQYEAAVRKWLAFLGGGFVEADTSEDVRDESAQKNSPFQILRSKPNCADLGLNPDPGALDHTLWALPNRIAVQQLAKLLREDPLFSSFKVVEATGLGEGSGERALKSLKAKIASGVRTITLTQGAQGMLTTGVTVPEWSGVFLLHDSESSEGYFQTAFRVQSPYTESYFDENAVRCTKVLKNEVYVFDFDPNRTLQKVNNLKTTVVDNRDGMKDGKELASLQEVLNFLPVIAFSGASFTSLDASEVVVWATSGITSGSFVREWAGGRVGTSDAVCQAIFDDPDLLEECKGLQMWAAHNDRAVRSTLKGKGKNKPVGFQANSNPALTEDLAKKEAASKGKKTSNKPELSAEEKAALKKAKEEKDLIRDILSYLKNRLPLFMFLTDDRESALVDVIDGVGADLFKETTNISKEAFAKLVKIGAFDARIWDGRVDKFRKLEAISIPWIDSSLQAIADQETGSMFLGAKDTRISIERQPGGSKGEIFAYASESPSGTVFLVEGSTFYGPEQRGQAFVDMVEKGVITSHGSGVFMLSDDRERSFHLSFPTKTKAAQFVLGDMSATGDEWELDREPKRGAD